MSVVRSGCCPAAADGACCCFCSDLRAATCCRRLGPKVRPLDLSLAAAAHTAQQTQHLVLQTARCTHVAHHCKAGRHPGQVMHAKHHKVQPPAADTTPRARQLPPHCCPTLTRHRFHAPCRRGSLRQCWQPLRLLLPPPQRRLLSQQGCAAMEARRLQVLIHQQQQLLRRVGQLCGCSNGCTLHTEEGRGRHIIGCCSC